MTRKYAFVTTLVGTLLIFPVGALADHEARSGGSRNVGGPDVRVERAYSGPGTTHVEVRKSTRGSGKTDRVQVIATPRKSRPIDPLEISVNAQVAVVQVVLGTNNKAVLDRVNVSITQNPQGGTNGQPGAGVGPPANSDNPPASPSSGPINISVNAQVAIVQVVVGRNNTATLDNINVNITQSGEGGAVANP